MLKVDGREGFNGQGIGILRSLSEKPQRRRAKATTVVLFIGIINSSGQKKRRRDAALLVSTSLCSHLSRIF